MDRIALLLMLLPAVFSDSPNVELYKNYNNVAGAVAAPDKDLGSVRYLGLLNSTEDCMKACVGLNKGKCYSFTYHTQAFGGAYAGHCYGVVDDPIWSPQKQDKIDSGRVLWPCQDENDCSLNGECMQSGECKCRPQWTGPRCMELILRPADPLSGYFYHPQDTNISSWGGAVLRWEKDNSYHMYIAEMRNHCGINSWTRNSQVVHAVSQTPTGTYTRKEVIRQPFAHEPDAVRGPKGEFVLFWSEYHYTSPLCNCSDGSTSPACKPKSPAYYYEYMSYSSSPNGPWSDPVAVLGPKREVDTNFAAVILKNGSLVGFTRWWNSTRPPFQGSRIRLVTASDWKDPSTYKESRDEVFPNLNNNGVEDPFLYIDVKGYYHAIFHNMYPGDIQENCGGHAYSKDGMSWTFGGRSFGNSVQFTDGNIFTFTRRERPHFVFDKDGVTPIALTNGAQYGGKYGDATYTLLQPVGPE